MPSGSFHTLNILFIFICARKGSMEMLTFRVPLPSFANDYTNCVPYSIAWWVFAAYDFRCAFFFFCYDITDYQSKTDLFIHNNNNSKKRAIIGLVLASIRARIT